MAYNGGKWLSGEGNHDGPWRSGKTRYERESGVIAQREHNRAQRAMESKRRGGGK